MIAKTIERQRTSKGQHIFWAFAALLLALPLVAMQFTNEVNWDGADFALAGGLLAAVGLAYEWAMRRTRNGLYRAAVGVALAATLLLLWIKGAVGLIGAEDNPANLMYFGVLAVGVAGAFVARFQPHGMARALFATALAHWQVALIAFGISLGFSWSGWIEVVFLNGFFVTLWLVSAHLFLQAAQDEPAREATA